MKIAYRGNFSQAHCTESHLSATMELLGHQVVRIQENAVPWREVPALCGGVDLFWFTTTWRDDFPGGHAVLAELHRRGLPTVSHSLDLFVGLEREHLLEADPFWRTRYVFTADGGHQEVFLAKGINHHWMPPGVFEPECYLAEPDPSLAQDVIFVGSYGYHPEWSYRPQLLDWLAATYGSRFTHYDHASGMRGHRLNQLYASAKVVVGDSCCPGFKQRNYWSDRVPETLGRGGFLIHPWVRGIEQQFHHQQHFVEYEYGHLRNLATEIDYYLTHEDDRERIRRVGHEWVKAHHTYTHRMKAMLEIVAAGEGWTPT